MAHQEDITGPGHLERAARLGRGFTEFLLTLAVTLLGLLCVTFVIGRVLPIDPVLSILGERATQAQVETARAALGLDKPLIVQFAIYVRDAFTGDFGTIAPHRPAGRSTTSVASFPRRSSSPRSAR